MIRTKRISIYVFTGELARFAAAAAEQGISLSAWFRDQATSASRDASPSLASLRLPLPRQPATRLTHWAGTSLTEEQFEALNAHARDCELTVSAFLRKVLLGVEPIARRPIARSAIAAVYRAGNHLNELVQQAGKGALPSEIMSAVVGLRAEVHALRDALLRVDAAAGQEPAG